MLATITKQNTSKSNAELYQCMQYKIRWACSGCQYSTCRRRPIVFSPCCPTSECGALQPLDRTGVCCDLQWCHENLASASKTKFDWKVKSQKNYLRRSRRKNMNVTATVQCLEQERMSTCLLELTHLPPSKRGRTCGSLFWTTVPETSNILTTT